MNFKRVVRSKPSSLLGYPYDYGPPPIVFGPGDTSEHFFCCWLASKQVVKNGYCEKELLPPLVIEDM